MNGTITLYEKCREGKTWFSLNDRCTDFAEVISKKTYMIPDGIEVCEDQTGEKHFYRVGDSHDYGEVATDDNGFPFIHGFLFNNGERIYLHQPNSNAEAEKKAAEAALTLSIDAALEKIRKALTEQKGTNVLKTADDVVAVFNNATFIIKRSSVNSETFNVSIVEGVPLRFDNDLDVFELLKLNKEVEEKATKAAFANAIMPAIINEYINKPL